MPIKLRPRLSTHAFFREAERTPGYTLFDWVHGYVYARWPYLYIGIGTGEHPLARAAKPIVTWLDGLIQGSARRKATSPSAGRGKPRAGFADTYHGKVVTLDAATQLVSLEQDVCLGDLEQIIPYQLARDLILKDPDHIVALECPCRSARAKPCLPLDVCLIVGEPFASFVVEHHGKRSRWVTQDEAASILSAEHDRGHVHHAFFKDAMLSRFYAICNCCECCCGAMQAQRNGVPMLAASGYVSRLDPDLCIGCGTCSEFCQFGALSVKDGINVVDWERCMGCGVCVDKCFRDALYMERDERKGIPLEMRALMADQAA